MYRNAHHELTIITMYSVSKYDGTGKCRLSEMIETMATRTDFEIRSLVLIYQSYNAVKLDAKCSAAQLRDAIDARLTKDLPYEEIMTLKDLTFEELMVYQSCLPRHTNLYTHPHTRTFTHARAHTHTHERNHTHAHTPARIRAHRRRKSWHSRGNAQCRKSVRLNFSCIAQSPLPRLTNWRHTLSNPALLCVPAIPMDRHSTSASAMASVSELGATYHPSTT